MVVLPIVALGATAILWIKTGQDLDRIRTVQRALIEEVSALRRSATIDLKDAPSRGSLTAKVVLVEFSDYECPYCIRHFRTTMPQLDANYIKPGKIRYVFRDFPIDTLHPEAIKAHEAARCAGEQDKFWVLHDRLFSAPGTHTRQALEALAGDAGLSPEPFRACLSSGRTLPAIRATGDIAAEFGAQGTPAFFVGFYDPALDQVRVTQAIHGAQPYEEFVKVLDSMIEQAK
jgi:protein-disulfide isomerase